MSYLKDKLLTPRTVSTRLKIIQSDLMKLSDGDDDFKIVADEILRIRSTVEHYFELGGVLEKSTRGKAKYLKQRDIFVFLWKGVLNEDKFALYIAADEKEAKTMFESFSKNRYDISEVKIKKITRNEKGLKLFSK